MPYRTLAVAILVAAGAGLVWHLRADAPPLVPADLPPAERLLVEFLLLLPVAALATAVVRTVIGLHTFGTFAPALLGLSFRDVSSAAGVFVLLVVLSIGWLVRRGLGKLNLLQVPRSAILLTAVVAMLVGYVLWSNARGSAVASAIPFLPLVIVTGLVERFWTMEEEDGTPAAARTMAATLLTAALVYVLVGWPWVAATLTAHPESLGFVAAALLMLGRYTGYRLTELWRFRDLA